MCRCPRDHRIQVRACVRARVLTVGCGVYREQVSLWPLVTAVTCRWHGSGGCLLRYVERTLQCQSCLSLGRVPSVATIWSCSGWALGVVVGWNAAFSCSREGAEVVPAPSLRSHVGSTMPASPLPCPSHLRFQGPVPHTPLSRLLHQPLPLPLWAPTTLPGPLAWHPPSHPP